MMTSSATASTTTEILALVVPAVAAVLLLALTYVVVRLAVCHGMLDAGKATDRVSAARRARRAEEARPETVRGVEATDRVATS